MKLNQYLKNILRHFSLVVLFLPCSLASYAQGQTTTQGKDFWLTFGKNSTYSAADCAYQIRVVATKATMVTLTYTNTGSIVKQNLAAGEVHTFVLDATARGNVNNTVTGTTNKSVRIQATEDITVYALNQRSATTDATNVLPVSNWGESYFHMTYIGVDDGYLVIAAENDTKVYDNGVLAATINQGQVYSRYHGATDNTGKKITSTKPIAYFVVNSSAEVAKGTSYYDCLFQQMLPVHVWGKRFLVPVSHRGKERMRILASQNGTVITQKGGNIQAGLGTGSLNLNAGQFVEMEIYSDSAGCYVSSNKPIAVASFLMGSGTSGLKSKDGDPALAWVPSLEQSVSSNIAMAPFFMPTGTQLNAHYALIVAPTTDKGLTSVSIGGSALQGLSGGSWKDNTTAQYSYYSMPLTDANATYVFNNDKGLTVMGYGVGSAESYYYLAAASSRQLDAAFYINNVHFQDINGQTYCDDVFTFDARIQYPLATTTSGHIVWYIDGVEHVPARDQLTWASIRSTLLGTHTIRLDVMDEGGNVIAISTTFTVVSELAAPLITATGDFCKGEPVSLSASGTGTFQWYKNGTLIPGATSSNYLTTGAGVYGVVASSTNCVSPMGTFDLTGSACLTLVDDSQVVFECSSVLIDVLANDVLKSAMASINVNPSTYGVATVVDNKVRYEDAGDCDGGKTDYLEYRVCDVLGNCNTATIRVSILSTPTITLRNPCGYSAQLELDLQYADATYEWEHSTDGASWTGVPDGDKVGLETSKAGYHRVKIGYAGLSVTTAVKELVLSNQTEVSGRTWCDMSLN